MQVAPQNSNFAIILHRALYAFPDNSRNFIGLTVGTVSRGINPNFEPHDENPFNNYAFIRRVQQESTLVVLKVR